MRSGSGRRGASSATRLVAVAGAFIALVILGKAHLDYAGIPALGYAGRRDLVRDSVLGGIEAAAGRKAAAIETWFGERRANALSIAAVFQFRRDLLDYDTRLRAYLSLNPGYRRIFLADAATGKVEGDSDLKPLGAPEDVAWLTGLTGLRIAADGTWTMAAATRSMAGKPYVIGIVMDPRRFFGELVADPSDARLGLESLILSGEGATLASPDARRDPPGLPPLPPASLRTLAGGQVVEVEDGRGGRVLARLVEARPSPAVTAGVLVLAEPALLEGPLRAELRAALAIGLLAVLLGTLLTAWAASRVFRPLGELERAVIAFSSGRAAILPRGAKGDMGLIVEAFRGLMEGVGARREELEREVKSRTLELEIRAAVDRSLAGSADDDLAYASVLEELGKQLGTAGGILSWFDGEDRRCAVVAGEGRARYLAEGEEALLEAAAGAGEAPFEGLGVSYPCAIAARLEAAGEAQGYVLLGCLDRRFDDARKAIVREALEDIAPLVAERRKRARQEAVRMAAERALRRSEERLRTFFDESRDMIYTSSPGDVVASVNTSGLSLLGLSDRFEILGREFRDFALSPGDRDFFLEKLRDQGFVSDYEIVLRRPDGSTVFCVESAHAVKDRFGAVLEIQGIVRDISERISRERELWQANLELAMANAKLKETQMLVVQREKLASIGQLAAGIAHEINNPLGFLKSNHAVMQGYLATMRKAWDEAAAADPATHLAIAERLDLAYVLAETGALVRDSDEGYARIMDIVKNLRNFSRIDSDTAFGPYDLDEGVRSTLVVARNEVKYVAEVELRLGSPPPIEASGGDINQVLLNVLVNSAQAIEGQKRGAKGRILVETRMEGEFAVCEISDDGPGIPPELRLRIFDPFFTTKDVGKGTGLGLSISYDIVVNKHGGLLSVEDSPMGGALFRIELPAGSRKAGHGD